MLYIYLFIFNDLLFIDFLILRQQTDFLLNSIVFLSSKTNFFFYFFSDLKKTIAYVRNLTVQFVRKCRVDHLKQGTDLHFISFLFCFLFFRSFFSFSIFRMFDSVGYSFFFSSRKSSANNDGNEKKKNFLSSSVV